MEPECIVIDAYDDSVDLVSAVSPRDRDYLHVDQVQDPEQDGGYNPPKQIETSRKGVEKLVDGDSEDTQADKAVEEGVLENRTQGQFSLVEPDRDKDACNQMADNQEIYRPLRSNDLVCLNQDGEGQKHQFVHRNHQQQIQDCGRQTVNQRLLVSESRVVHDNFSFKMFTMKSTFPTR